MQELWMVSDSWKKSSRTGNKKVRKDIGGRW
jgi:hypothetical protein